MLLTQRIRAEPETLDRPRRQVLHENVGACHQFLQDRARRRMLDVERHALLRSVGPDEMRRLSLHRAVVGARRIAGSRPLDLDHAGA